MEYRRDLAAGYTPEQADAEEEHVRAHLSAVADADDDPTTRADEVAVYRTVLPGGGLAIVGNLAGQPTAPYLQPGYDPLAGVDPGLYAAEVDAAQADEEATRG